MYIIEGDRILRSDTACLPLLSELKLMFGTAGAGLTGSGGVNETLRGDRGVLVTPLEEVEIDTVPPDGKNGTARGST